MITFLKGTLENKNENRIELDVNGVGYAINIPATVFKEMPAVGNSLKIWISVSTGLYGGETTYYGFTTEEQRDLFDLIRSISKIGAKAALGVISKISGSMADFKRAVIEKNTNVLTGVFCLTPKTAEKIVIGLKGKLDDLKVPAGATETGTPREQVLEDALEGLISMGYREVEAREALRYACRHYDNIQTPQEMIKRALKYFLKR
jgi:Holliday junction DNA helicase RuvA